MLTAEALQGIQLCQAFHDRMPNSSEMEEEYSVDPNIDCDDLPFPPMRDRRGALLSPWVGVDGERFDAAPVAAEVHQRYGGGGVKLENL